MACGVNSTIFLVVSLVVVLILMLVGAFAPGWKKCKDGEYGLFEVCSPGGFCRSYESSDDFATARTAAQALILTGTAATAICLIYSVIRLILMITHCGPDCYGKGVLTTVAGVLLISGGALCIAGVVVFVAEVEVPCGRYPVNYSVYITGAGGVIDIIGGFLLLPYSERNYPNWNH